MTVDGAAAIRTEISEIVPEYSFQTDNTRQIGNESFAERHFGAMVRIRFRKDEYRIKSWKSKVRRFK
jgi:hypothetical protein